MAVAHKTKIMRLATFLCFIVLFSISGHAQSGAPKKQPLPPSVSAAIRAAKRIPQISSAKSVGVICNISADPSKDEGPCKVAIANLKARTPYQVVRCIAIAGGGLGVVCPEGKKTDLQVAVSSAGGRSSIYKRSVIITIGWKQQGTGSDVPVLVCKPPKNGDTIDAAQCTAQKLVGFLESHGMPALKPKK